MSWMTRRFRTVSLTLVCITFAVSLLQCTPQQQEQLTGLPSGSTNPAVVNQFAVLAPPKADLNQVRNGSGTSMTTPAWSWENGNVNASQAHMIEGYSIPYRCVLENMPTGVEIRLVLGYDVKHSDKHAIDYLTHYQRLEPHNPPFAHSAEVINPLVGVSGVDALTTTWPLPAPRVNEIVSCLPGNFSQPETSFNGLPANERVMTLFGGTLTNVLFDTDGGFTGPDFADEQSEERIAISFILDSPTAVLAWGGHIGSREDWGCPNDPQSAGGISGSPYHMRRHGWSGDDSLPNLGSTDRSLSAGAIFVVDCGTCEVDGPSTVCQGTTNEYTSTITGDCDTPVHSWSVTAGDCSIDGADDEASVMIVAGTTASCTIQDALSCSECQGTPLPCELTITVNPTSTASAGDNQSICQSESGESCFDPLDGNASGGTPSWSVISEPSMGCVDITNGSTATPTVCFAEGCTGQATLRITVPGAAPCPDDTDDVILTVRARPVADAGDDQTICQAESGETCFAPLAGDADNGTPSWSVISEPSMGCVDITNGNTATPTVCFAAGCTGQATLRLTVTGTSPCTTDADDVILTVTARPAADAGDDQSTCQAMSGATCFTPLAGDGDNGTPLWSVIDEPSPNCVDITNGDTATPTVCFAEGCTGEATLRMTVTGTAPCTTDTDDVTLTVTAESSASAGDDQSICQATSGETCFAPLAGSGMGGTPSWSVDSEPSANCVDITNGNSYTPTVCFAEGCTGQATLKLTVMGDEPCPDAEDTVTLTVRARSTASAGPNDTKCQAVSGETCFGPLAGSASGGTPTWSVQSEPSVGCVDITNGNTATPTVCFEAGCTGSATLRITVPGTSPCPNATDEVTLTVVERPTASAGDNDTACQATTGETCFGPLDASASGGTPSWSVESEPEPNCVDITNGDTATPTVCFAEGCTGTATVRLTVTGTSPCPNATDDIDLTVVARPTAAAGDDDGQCQAESGETCFGPLAGSGSNGTPSWSVVSEPSPNCVDITDGDTYTPTICFAANCSGSATLRLTVTGTSPCPNATDDVVFTVTGRPTCTLSAPDPLPSCRTTGNQLTADISGGSGDLTLTWMLTGDGWEITDGQGTDTITYSTGLGGAGTFTLEIVDNVTDCEGSCEVTFECNPNESDCFVTPITGFSCDDGSAMFCAQAVTGIAPFQITWYDDMDNVLETCSDRGLNETCCFTVTDPAEGTYFYHVVIMDSGTPPSMDTCNATLLVGTCEEFCSLTQGAYGNAGGTFNGLGTLDLIESLLASDLTVGKPGRSVTIQMAAAQCIIDRMPTGGTAMTLPNNLGAPILNAMTCQTSPVGLPLFANNGRWKNILLGQTVTLALNMRLDPMLANFMLPSEAFCTQATLPGEDGLHGGFDNDDELDPGPDGTFGCNAEGINDDPIIELVIPPSVLAALTTLGLDHDVTGLLELCNRALAGQDVGGANLGAITEAADVINRGFDECRIIVPCPEPCPPPPEPTTMPS
ncbi:MAG TPA: hypothetical protein VJZ71_02475 [Phycisphaerae bacterium]|nr:hypothetical protein [Phycisphaerae bacterium]